MITSEAANLAISIASGVIKLTHRLDLVLAEKVAVEAPLPLVQPNVVLAPTVERMISALGKLLTDTANSASDPLGINRPEIQGLVTAGEAGQQVDPADLLFWMEKYLPRQALGRTLNLNSTLMKSVAKVRPHWDLTDPSIRAAAFYISPGVDDRKKGYTWRIALTVADVVTELGAENAAIFTRDEKIQGIVRSLLGRFGESDLQSAESWEGMLRSVLSATLNGVLDAKEFYDVDNRWLDGLLDALHTARESAPEAKRDQFLLGLLDGRGYPQLVSTLLETAASRLEPEDAEVFKKIAADVLTAAAEQLQETGQFKVFLSDHWGDLLRAGLGSLAQHGRQLLEDDSPLVAEVIVGVVGCLAETPNRKFLTADTLIGLVDAAVAAVAVKPELLSDAIDVDWLELLVRSVTGAVATQGIVSTFGREGLEAILKRTLAGFAEHPELIIEDADLARELLRGVLTKLTMLDRFSAETLATAAIEGSLQVLSEQPDLLGFQYADMVSQLAGKVGALVSGGALTHIQGADLLRAVVETLAENPALFLKAERGLADRAVDVILSVSQGSQGGLIAGAVFVHVTQAVVEALARSGSAALANHPLTELGDLLENVLNAGLVRAEREIGNRIGRSALPAVLGDLVAAWARGEVATIDPDNQNFKRLFSELADKAAA